MRPEDVDRLTPAQLTALIEELTASLTPPDPVEFARAVAGIEPDPWQAQVLRSDSRRILLNCSRQSGKSTTTAILALHRALTAPKSTIIVVSPSDRQSGELFRKVEGVLAKVPSQPKLREHNKRSLELPNGSRIISLPASEDTIRGFSAVSLIIEDEAGDVPDELYLAVRPMLAVSNGQLILMGTPKGRRGHFFEAWERGGAEWERVQITADEVPRISSEFLASERVAMGRNYEQEYCGTFLDGATGRVYAGYDEARNMVHALPA